MRLIHVKTLKIARIGDAVTSFRGATGTIKYFVPPHKPCSVGHVSVDYTDRATMPGYNYVSVWGLEWIEREDRHSWTADEERVDTYNEEMLDAEQYPAQKDCTCRSTTHCQRYGNCE